MEKKNLELITNLRHLLHAHPELSMEEVWTRKELKDFIETHTKLSVTDRGHWLYAYYNCGDPEAETVAFRADFDALPMQEKQGLSYGSVNPGVCHKCGHDGHSAVLAGLALELDQRGSDRNVCLIFQHAEEIGGGGAECAELIPERGISKVFAFHNMSGYPEKAIVLKRGVAHCTSKGFTVRMQGTPAHASQPEDGKNPTAALAELALFQDEASKRGIYLGFVLSTVVHMGIGSKNFGIAASSGELSLTLRADYEADLNCLEQQVREKAEELAEKYGLTVSYSETDFFPETVNHDDAVEEVRRMAAELGYPVVDLEKAFRGSEDFGYYLKKCPGAIMYIGNGEEYPQIHTSEYDFNDRILETAVDMFAGLAGCRQ